MRWLRVVLVLLVPGLSTPAAAVFADEPAPPTPAERRALFQRMLADAKAGEALAEAGRFAEALPKAQAAYDASVRLHGPTHPMTGALEAGLGATLHALGRLEEARTVLERVLAHQTSAREPGSPFLAKARSSLAVLYADLGRTAEAEELLRRAVESYEATLAAKPSPRIAVPIDLALVVALSNRANALLALGRPREAVELMERALASAERLRGPRHLDTARALLNLGAAWQELGEYGRAEGCARRALSVLEEQLGPASPLAAVALGNLGSALVDLGRYEEARDALRRSLASPATSEPGAARDAASRFMNQALLLERMGEPAAAVEALQQALARHEAAFGPDHPDTIECLGNLAAALSSAGRTDAALRVQQRALERGRAALGPEHPRVGWLLQNLGVQLLEAGRPAEALPHLERALELGERAEGGDHPHVAYRAAGLASAYERLGRRQDAVALQRRAVAVVERRLGRQHPETAIVVSGLARLLHEGGARDEARPLFERALAITREAFGEEHLATVVRLHNVGRAELDAGQRPAAAASFARSLDGLERVLERELPGLVGPERLALAGAARETFLRFEEATLGLGVSGYPEALRFKGLVSRLERSERALARRADAAQAALVDGLRQAGRRLATLAQAVPSGADPERLRAWQREYAEAQREHAERARAFAAAARGHAGPDDPRRDPVAAVQAGLPADALLIDVLRTEGRYLAWVVAPRGPEVRVDLGPAARLDAAAQAFAEAVARARSAGEPALLEAGAELRRLLIVPLERWLTPAVARLVFAPDGALAAAPLAALPGRAPGRWLIDEHALELVSMAQDLAGLDPGAARGERALLVGDVDFGPPGAAASAAEPAEPAPTDGRSSRGARFRPLEGAAAEIEHLRERLGERATVLRGAEATEAAVRQQLRDRWLLHVATHGFASSGARLEGALATPAAQGATLGALDEVRLATRDPRLLSGLALAGANRSHAAWEDDGILTALEAAQLDLTRCRLVVLSACETALGRVESGEGVIGLVQALQEAGARDVVASLWRVDDRATALLMQRFYDGLLRAEDPLAAARALREAALWLRDAKPEGRDLSAPRHWAPFVAYSRR